MDFSLVTGALCLLSFSNGLYYNRGTFEISVNINSTGSYPMHYRVGGLYEYSHNPGLSDAVKCTQYRAGAPNPGLWIFTGDKYIIQSVAHYSDYPDVD